LQTVGCIAAVLLAVVAHVRCAPYTAVEVVSYTPGTGTSASLRNSSAALSLPGSIVPGWLAAYPDEPLSPLTPHYSGDHLVQVGSGGEITLRLERYVTVSPSARELGVWENVFLTAGPGGGAGDPATVGGADSATVEVSANGIDFFSAGTFTFNWFGNYWADIESKGDLTGSVIADFGRPFTGSLSGFDGLSFTQTIAQLDGTAGGTWLDLDASGLSEVGWVRFTGVAPGSTLELDGVSINSDLAGAETVPEPSVTTLVLLSLAGGLAKHVQKKRLHAD